jgi:hypothetical protein
LGRAFIPFHITCAFSRARPRLRRLQTTKQQLRMHVSFHATQPAPKRPHRLGLTSSQEQMPRTKRQHLRNRLFSLTRADTLHPCPRSHRCRCRLRCSAGAASAGRVPPPTPEDARFTYFYTTDLGNDNHEIMKQRLSAHPADATKCAALCAGAIGATCKVRRAHAQNAVPFVPARRVRDRLSSAWGRRSGDGQPESPSRSARAAGG